MSVTFLSFPPGNRGCDNRGCHGEGADNTEDIMYGSALNTEDIMYGSALSVPSSRPLRLKKLKKVTLNSNECKQNRTRMMRQRRIYEKTRRNQHPS
ncbi:MAG: hypothetical protein B6245_23395 [Desulfobacteraceae bacterium 4572_88]|nr:MAG: hypothetical protein B6245_23395 [Desulfobacteraceae bacterium 4572_88]